MVCLAFSVLSLTVMKWDCRVKMFFLCLFFLCSSSFMSFNCMFWLWWFRLDSPPCAPSLCSVPCGGSVPSLPRLLRGREARRPRRKLMPAVLPAWRRSVPADQWAQRRLALRPERAHGTVSDHQPFSQGQLNTSYTSFVFWFVVQNWIIMSVIWEACSENKAYMVVLQWLA